MKLSEKLERKLGRFAIPNLTNYLVVGQAIFFLVLIAKPELYERMLYIPQLAMHGEWWRFFTLLFVPKSLDVIYIVLALNLFYIMGNTLETLWGSLRYNLFVLIAYVMSILAAMLVPYVPGVPGVAADNSYIGCSVFLAFAVLFPDFVIRIYFIFPVRVKWLALAVWGYFGYQFITGSNMDRVLVLAATANFTLFFFKDIYSLMRYGAREMKKKSEAIADQEKPFHRCTACGLTDKDDPKMEFRYCPSCKGGLGYCTKHIFDHQHVV